MASSAVQSPDLVRSPCILRDNDYYYSSGDSVIRVENTLFKIHKAYLSHNSPVFASMFDLPAGMGDVEGSSDDLPIVLEGEKAEVFRAVLKYIYAPPTQVQIHSMTMAALPDVIFVAKFAEKYAMDYWKEWTKQFLGSRLDNLGGVSAETLPDLYSLSNELQDTDVRDQIMERWCEIVEADDLPIIPVLAAADAARDEKGLAALYCIQICRWETQKPANAFNSQSLTLDGVSPDHLLRMLSGYASLSLAWNRLRTQEPYPFQQAGCHAGYSSQNHDTLCIPHYRSKWTEAVLKAECQYPRTTQLPSRLTHFGEYLQQNSAPPSSSTKIMADCFYAFAKEFNHRVQNNMHFLIADHFFPKHQMGSSNP